MPPPIEGSDYTAPVLAARIGRLEARVRTLELEGEEQATYNRRTREIAIETHRQLAQLIRSLHERGVELAGVFPEVFENPGGR